MEAWSPDGCAFSRKNLLVEEPISQPGQDLRGVFLGGFDDERACSARLAEKIGEKVTYNKVDFAAGLWPYNLVVVPGGRIALTADNGGGGSSDGNVDTVSVVDLTGPNPPHVIDKVVVGDGPEGLAVSPKGNVAVAAILAASNNKSVWFHRKDGYISVLKIDGKKVTKIKELNVGGLPEAALFTPDGKYLLVGNYLTQDFSILRVSGTDITDTGKRFKVPGHPASARASAK